MQEKYLTVIIVITTMTTMLVIIILITAAINRVFEVLTKITME